MKPTSTTGKKKQKTLTSFFGTPTTTKNSNDVDADSAHSSVIQMLPSSLNNGGEYANGIGSLPTSTPNSSNSTCSWPSIWTEDMWERKKAAFPWLDSIEGKLGCTTCKKVVHLVAFKKECASISKEWTANLISHNGSDKAAQLTSLRKKIFERKKSTSHEIAAGILKKSKEETMYNVVDKWNESQLETTKTVFRTAYSIAKNNRPCTDHYELLELQKMNGLDVGVGLHSKRTAMEIICHIFDEMKKTIVGEILQISGKISVLIDESTSLGSQTSLIVYLKCEISKEKPPHYLFFDLIELADQTAKTVTENLLHCLRKQGFDEAYLKEHLVAFANDSASVMQGKKSGVSESLLEKFLSLIVWHCMNHRLELALSDAVNEVGAVDISKFSWIKFTLSTADLQKTSKS